jgi:hypothetical protein
MGSAASSHPDLEWCFAWKGPTMEIAAILPDALIDYLPSFLNESLQFYSCFISSVVSQWVEQSVETALARERQQSTTILFPVRIDNTVMTLEMESIQNTCQNRSQVALGLNRTRNNNRFEMLILRREHVEIHAKPRGDNGVFHAVTLGRSAYYPAPLARL